MNIIACSDFHGQLPEIKDCDLLLIAGDICPLRMDWHNDLCMNWLDKSFRKWLSDLRDRKIKVVGIAGNHDFVFEQKPKEIEELKLPWIYLENSSTEIDGVRIYGTPNVPALQGWAFYKDAVGLRGIADSIPEDTEIILAHSPPYGLCDGIYEDGAYKVVECERVGNKELRNSIARINPNWIICGHIHTGRHSPHYVNFGKTKVVNVSILNESYTREFDTFEFYYNEFEPSGEDYNGN